MMGYCLRIERGNQPMITLPIDGQTTSIGRDSKNDVHLPIGTISRQQCEIADRNGRLVVTNHSENGTVVNSKELVGDTSCRVGVGSIIELGEIRIVIQAAIDEEAFDSTFSPDTTALPFGDTDFEPPEMYFGGIDHAGKRVWKRIRSGMTIGRDSDSSISLDEPKVSRKHCTIKSERGSWVLHNESRNGTMVKDVKVTDGAVLELGHTIQVGSTILKVASREDSDGGIIGESSAIRKVLKTISRVAPSDFPVLILGETGTGKGLAAEAIHKKSKRHNKPFVTLDCSAISPSLIESELFGHVKGAFTDAARERKGLFLEANGGTIFLDEIGEMPVKMQAKLLSVLQDGRFRPVGSDKSTETDVRVIAATNRDVEALVEDGEFRKDLYYRIKGIIIKMPPLRERYEDIPLLADHFLQSALKSLGRRMTLSYETHIFLREYPWPGNVRELKTIIERAAIFSDEGPIMPAALMITDDDEEVFEDDQQYKFTSTIIKKALERSNNSGRKAASSLGLNNSTFRGLMKKYI
jgi:transcriptional regulator with PAS, ATPase and Fis domain